MSDRGVPETLPIDEGVKALLETVVNKPVDFARAPLDDDGNSVEPPYVIIYPIPGGGGFSGPPFCAPDADVEVMYQIRVVALRWDQARNMADLVRRALVGRTNGAFTHPLDLGDMTCTMRKPEGSPGQVRRDGKIFYEDDDYCVQVTTS